MPIPTLNQTHEAMRHHWDKQRYPALVYVETTNFCNARCTFCLYDRMERPVEFMKLNTFKAVADKVKARGLDIRAMFCFGEPLADKDLFNKIRYARSIGVMRSALSLNTNVSLLTPDKYDDILSACNNITLSFVNTGDTFERLTGLSWVDCYEKAVAFIKYRDQHRRQFIIRIGCNDVTGHDRERVRIAFAAFNVQWARDAQIEWGGKTITGPIDRTVMRKSWKCDAFKGAMQVKPNGDCAFCAYDVVRNETVFANILTDDWDTIEHNFKQLWLQPSSLCLRCDFWWNYKQLIAGGGRRGKHIDSSWQRAYEDNMRDFWEQQHVANAKRYLTGSSLKRVLHFAGLNSMVKPGKHVLNIGVGSGRCTNELVTLGVATSALDISQSAIDRVSEWTIAGYTDPANLPENEYDVAICHLVVQHMADVDVYGMLRHVVRSLKPQGILSVQFAAPPGDEVYAEGLERQQKGVVRRTPEHFERIVRVVGGEVIYRSPPRFHDPAKATDDNVWHAWHIRRRADK